MPSKTKEKKGKKPPGGPTYKVERRLFLELWSRVYNAGGNIDQLVQLVKSNCDGDQISDKKGRMPVFHEEKCKQRCDRIIKRCEKDGLTAPIRLPGHGSLKDDLRGLTW